MMPEWSWIALAALNVFVAIFWLAARLRVTVGRGRTAATSDRRAAPLPTQSMESDEITAAGPSGAEPPMSSPRIASPGENRLAEDLARWRRMRRVEETPGLDAWVREADRGDVGPAAEGGGDRPRAAVNGRSASLRPSAARQSS